MSTSQLSVRDCEPSVSFDVESRQLHNQGVLGKLRTFLDQTFPSMLFLLLWRIQETVVLLYIGNSSPSSPKNETGASQTDLIAGFRMGTQLTNFLFNSVAFWLNGSLEMLVSKTKGALDFDMCPVYLHRSNFGFKILPFGVLKGKLNFVKAVGIIKL